jgi:hypothetical protein
MHIFETGGESAISTIGHVVSHDGKYNKVNAWMSITLNAFFQTHNHSRSHGDGILGLIQKVMARWGSADSVVAIPRTMKSITRSIQSYVKQDYKVIRFEEQL